MRIICEFDPFSPSKPSMSLWLDMPTVLVSLLRQQIHEAGQRFFDGMMANERQELVHRFVDLDENGDGRISVQELLNRYGGRMNGGGAAVQDRVRVLFHLVDRDGNGLLDFDECKALFFLFACGRVCDLCSGLIIRDGVSCIYCFSVYFDLCGSCFHQTQQQQQHYYYYYYYYSFQALPPLIRSGPQQPQLPPVIALQAPTPLQHYYNQGFPYHNPQFQLPFLHHHHHHHHVVAAPQQNAPNNIGGIGGPVYGVLAMGSAISNIMDIFSSCPIM